MDIREMGILGGAGDWRAKKHGAHFNFSVFDRGNVNPLNFSFLRRLRHRARRKGG
jgi:hypothetical protein